MWLHVPASCRSALATAASTSLSETSARELERSATWRGKPRRWQSWQRAWLTAGWMTLLSGVTSPRSMLQPGVDAWISSWRDSRVSPSASPVTDADKMTSAGSGRSSETSSSDAGLQLSFSRTFLESSPRDSATFSGTLPRSGSLRNGAVTARPRSGPLTVGTAGSAWPTPDAGVSMHSNRSQSSGAATRPNPALIAKQGTWATPTASENSNRTTRIAPTHGKSHGMVLAGQAAEHGRNWPTPTATDAKASGAAAYLTASGRHAGTTLTDAAVRLWPTPCTSDSKRTESGDPPRTGGPSLVGAINGHPHETTAKDGASGWVLNPEFVEALMGLPRGWTDSGCSGTASSASKQHEPCAISRSGPEVEMSKEVA